MLCALFFFFNDTATTEIYTLSLHDALPIFRGAYLVVAESGRPADRGRASMTSRDNEAPVERLTDTEYWDSTYAPLSIGLSRTGHFKTLLRRLLGPTVLEYMRDYGDYLMWDVIYPKFLFRRRGARV